MKNVIKVVTLAAALVGSSAAFAIEGDAFQNELQRMINESVDGQVQAKVENGGVIRLGGYVEEKSQINMLVAKLRKIEGVTDVTSTVTTSD